MQGEKLEAGICQSTSPSPLQHDISNAEHHRALWEKAVDEEHEFLNAHHSRVNFFVTILSTLVGATVAGAMKAVLPIHFLLLLSGPVLVAYLSEVAIEGTFRFYQRFLEAVVLRAKFEQLLGFHKCPTYDSARYWGKETLIQERYMERRCLYTSSQDFVVQNSNLGYQGVAVRTFRCFQNTGCILAVLLVYAWLESLSK